MQTWQLLQLQGSLWLIASAIFFTGTDYKVTRIIWMLGAIVIFIISLLVSLK